MGFQEDFFVFLHEAMAGRTQAELADRAEITQSQLSKLLGSGSKSKTNDPRLSTVARLLDAFDVTLCERGSANEEAQQTIKELRDGISRIQEELEEVKKEKEQFLGQVNLLREMLREREKESVGTLRADRVSLIGGVGKTEGQTA